MGKKKAATGASQLHVKVSPDIRTAALARAAEERRSLNNWIEGLILAALDREATV